MSGKKTSELDINSALSGLEYIPIVQPIDVPRSNKRMSIDSLMSKAPVISVNSKTGAVTLVAHDIGALASGDNVSSLVNDAGYLTSAGVVIQNDITVTLSNGKSLGPYVNGQTIPSTGKNLEQIITLLAQEYLTPSFLSGSIAGLASILESGVSVSGIKTWNWTTSNSTNVTVNSIAIEDHTSSTAITSGQPNSGSFTGTIDTVQLNSPGSRVWRISMTDTHSGSHFIDITINWAYYNWYGVGSTPTNSSQVRALSNTFNSTFSIPIAQGQTVISFAYPATHADISDSSVKYVEGFNSNVGATFTKTLVNVLDAGGNTVSYKVWSTTLGGPYPSSATYNVTVP